MVISVYYFVQGRERKTYLREHAVEDIRLINLVFHSARDKYLIGLRQLCLQQLRKLLAPRLCRIF